MTAAFALGILVERLTDIPVFYCLALACLSIVFCGIFFRTRRVFVVCLLAASLSLGGIVFKSRADLPPGHLCRIIGEVGDQPRPAALEGIVADRPRAAVNAYGQRETRFLLSVDRLDAGRSCGLVVVRMANPLSVRYGDRVILHGELLSPMPPTNPGQFDYKSFLERKKIFYVLTVKEENSCAVIERDAGSPVRSFAYRVSGKIEALIDRFWGSCREGSLLKAILLGERGDVDAEINETFVATGTVHILAISGLHVGLLASLFIIFFKFLRVPFRVWVVPLALLLAFYCVMVDNRPPVVRATVMMLVYLAGRLLRREPDILNSLAFAALLLLAVEPADLFDTGFQLSFVSVASIVYCMPLFEKRAAGENRVKAYIRAGLLVSLAACLGSAPLVARYFNIVSPISLVANLFVIPWMFVILAASLVFIAFGLIWHPLGLIFGEASRFGFWVLVKAVSLFAKIPYAYWRVPSPPWAAIAGWYLFFYLLLNRRRFRMRTSLFVIAALLACNIAIWNRACAKSDNSLRITFLDVGKGDSAFVEFPGGPTMLIDGGDVAPYDFGRIVVGRFLASRGINSVDIVVATHPHADHLGGLLAVLDNFTVRYVIDTGDSDAGPLYRQYQGLLARGVMRRITVQQGDSIRGLGDVRVDVLNPPRTRFAAPNDNSMVLKLCYRGVCVLMGGDIKEEAARSLAAKYGAALSSEILKVPHHGGSLGEATQAFIQCVKPRVAVISTRNRIVSDSLLSSLAAAHVVVYRTDKNGAVAVTVGADRILQTYSCK